MRRQTRNPIPGNQTLDKARRRRGGGMNKWSGEEAGENGGRGGEDEEGEIPVRSINAMKHNDDISNGLGGVGMPHVDITTTLCEDMNKARNGWKRRLERRWRGRESEKSTPRAGL